MNWGRFENVSCERSFRRYRNLIETFQNKPLDCETEKHHIFPRSLFPEFSKEKWNLVELPIRVHFIAHYLLYKMYPSTKMAASFNLMAQRSGGYRSKLYEIHRVKVKEEIGNQSRGKKWYYNPETNERIFIKGKVPKGFIRGCPESVREMMREKHSGNLWWHHSEHGVLRSKTCPGEGWLLGRGEFKNNKGLEVMNHNSIKVLDLRDRCIKLIPIEGGKFKWQINHPGISLNRVRLFVRDNFVYTFKSIPIPKANKTKYDGFENWVCPKPSNHKNQNEERKKFFKQHEGKSLKDLGFDVYSLKDFEWKDEYVVKE